MRPKKIILLVNEVEAERSVLAYTLKVNGYRVLEAGALTEAVLLFRAHPVDLTILSLEPARFRAVELARRLKQAPRSAHLLLLGANPLKPTPAAPFADAVLGGRTLSTTELLERVRVLAARKRGPAKGSPRPAPPAAPARPVEASVEAVCA